MDLRNAKMPDELVKAAVSIAKNCDGVEIPIVIGAAMLTERQRAIMIIVNMKESAQRIDPHSDAGKGISAICDALISAIANTEAEEDQPIRYQ